MPKDLFLKDMETGLAELAKQNNEDYVEPAQAFVNETILDLFSNLFDEVLSLRRRVTELERKDR